MTEIEQTPSEYSVLVNGKLVHLTTGGYLTSATLTEQEKQDLQAYINALHNA